MQSELWITHIKIYGPVRHADGFFTAWGCGRNVLPVAQHAEVASHPAVPVGRDQEHGDLGLADDVGGDVACDEAFEHALAGEAEDDHGAPACLGGVEDGLGRVVGEEHDAVGGNAGLTELVAEELEGLLAALGGVGLVLVLLVKGGNVRHDGLGVEAPGKVRDGLRELFAGPGGRNGDQNLAAGQIGGSSEMMRNRKSYHSGTCGSKRRVKTAAHSRSGKPKHRSALASTAAVKSSTDRPRRSARNSATWRT